MNRRDFLRKAAGVSVAAAVAPVVVNSAWTGLTLPTGERLYWGKTFEVPWPFVGESFTAPCDLKIVNMNHLNKTITFEPVPRSSDTPSRVMSRALYSKRAL